jgi:hypothetical protein
MSTESARSISLTPIAGAVAVLRFVQMNAAEVEQCGNTLDAIGISLEASAVATQIAIPVALLDGAKLEVEAGAVVAAGVRVMSDATGRCITAVGATARVLGTSLTASGAAGEVITIIARPASGEFVA